MSLWPCGLRKKSYCNSAGPFPGSRKVKWIKKKIKNKLAAQVPCSCFWQIPQQFDFVKNSVELWMKSFSKGRKANLPVVWGFLRWASATGHTFTIQSLKISVCRRPRSRAQSTWNSRMDVMIAAANLQDPHSQPFLEILDLYSADIVLALHYGKSASAFKQPASP